MGHAKSGGPFMQAPLAEDQNLFPGSQRQTDRRPFLERHATQVRLFFRHIAHWGILRGAGHGVGASGRNQNSRRRASASSGAAYSLISNA